MIKNFSYLSYYLGKVIFANPKLWIKFGDFESKFLQAKISLYKPNQPIYITGLARSGTTFMLENLAKHPDCVSHQYRDYPMIFTPYFWNKLVSLFDFNVFSKSFERSHQDGVKVSAKSPEALEEVIWQFFFDHLHDVSVNNILDDKTINEKFDKFYQEHIIKLLLARNGKRYLAKANYNLTRIEYLLRLNPQTKILIMIRNPFDHIASIIKQDKIFSQSHKKFPKTLDFMHMSGHYEFGIDKKLLNIGHNYDFLNKNSNQISLEDWSLYWHMIYNYVKTMIAKFPSNTKLVRYEDLCKHPYEVLSDIHGFCDLKITNEGLDLAASSIRKPTSQRDFSPSDLALISSNTQELASYFGY